MVRLGPAIGFALVAGCTLATIPNGVILCSSGTCPSGFACQGDGHCWQLGTGPDAGMKADAGRTDGGPADAGNDGGGDAGLDGGPPNCAGEDAGGCVICSTDGALPDLLYPRWGLGGAYIAYAAGSEIFERIFAVGGFNSPGATTADVQFDELDTGNAWAEVGNTNLTARALFPLVSRHDVGLFAIGGEDQGTGTVLGDTLILATNAPPIPTASWTSLGEDLIQPRFGHGAVVELDARSILVCGGSGLGVPLSTCEVLPDVDGGWQAGPAMTYERNGLSMATGSDGNVYAFSGSGNSTASLTSWEMLDASGLWTCPGTCPQMLSGHVNGAAVVVGSKIYVMGGVALPAETSNNIVEVLNVNDLAGGWQVLAGMPTARSFFGAVATPTGTIRVFGGHGGPDNTCTIANVEEYTPSNNTWK